MAATGCYSREACRKNVPIGEVEQISILSALMLIYPFLFSAHFVQALMPDHLILGCCRTSLDLKHQISAGNDRALTAIARGMD